MGRGDGFGIGRNHSITNHTGERMNEEKKAKKKAEKQAAKERREEKQRQKEERKKAKEKPYRVHIERRNRFIQIILWVVIGIFLALGIFSFATREDTVSVRNALKQAVSDANTTSSYEERASSFAMAFVYDYFTYDPELSDVYVKKINEYAAEGLTLEAPAANATSTVSHTSIKNIETTGNGMFDVTVQAQIESSGIMQITTTVKNAKGKDEKKVTQQAQTTSRLLNYRVPVNVENGNCAVLSEPLLIAEANAAKRVTLLDDMTGTSVDDTELHNVTVLAQNFLSAYYGADRNELEYFVTSNFGEARTVGAGIRFQEIQEIEVVKRTDGSYEAEIQYTISDNMVTQEQRVFLTIVTGEENRLYVDQMATRPE